MRILALDCASVSASVALLEDETVLGEGFINVKLTHSQTLLPMVEQLLQNTKTTIQEVDAFAVTVGPGSFTGVRIGVAAIKGMADAVKKSCYAVSALEASAYPFEDFKGIVCPLMDARRDQVYTALFKDGERLLEDSAMSTAELLEILKKFPNEKVLLVGDGAQKGYDAFYQKDAERFILCKPQFRYVRASSVGFLAEKQKNNGIHAIPSQQLLPLYLRLPQAQRELNNKKKNKN